MPFERLRTWQREPLVRFLSIGALIFACNDVVQSWHADASRQIQIDGPLQQRIIELSRAQSGLTPSGEQLARLIDNYIDDEVRYREALRQGLDRDDEIVRRRLIQKVMFLQHDLAAPAAASDADLHAYYDAHVAAFREPATLSFEQLYFSADHGGWSEAEQRAWQVHARLAADAGVAAHSGDPLPLVIPDGELSRAQAVALFGDTPLIDSLFSAPIGSWSAPVQSGYGWHLFRVTHRTPMQVPAFEQVRAQVEAAWRDEQTQTVERRELDGLRLQYQITRTP